MKKNNPPPAERKCRVCVAMPVFQGAAFLDETLLSVLTQSGPFTLDVYVHDGGSTDGTVERLKDWKQRLEQGGIPVGCQAVRFQFASARDEGMYDALERAFAALQPGDADLMTYVNSDDLLAPNAIRFAVEKMSEFPDIEWLSGRPCELDASGQMRKIHDPQVFPCETLTAGLHDGVHLPFVMQEGTFWKGSLWRKAGGIRPDLRLAGDFDLWMRFARHAELVSADVVLGMHRRHPAQLSAGANYHEELETKVIDATVRARRDRIWSDIGLWRSGTYVPLALRGSYLTFAPEREIWVKDTRWLPRGLGPTRYVSRDRAQAGGRVEFGSGFGAEEYPDLRINLVRGARFARLGANQMTLHADSAGVWLLFIRLRNFAESATLILERDDVEVMRRELPKTDHGSEILVSTDIRLEAGANLLVLRVKESADGPGLGLLLIRVEAIPAEMTF